MKIGMMSSWNVPCGVAVHAELLGRAWVEMGHELKVFAPAPIEWKVKQSLKAAKDYVMKKLSYEIGKRFIELFESLGAGGVAEEAKVAPSPGSLVKEEVHYDRSVS
ncbi:MAG TPA: hypothetical protein C5S37_13420 [Methanophagales archaeon]|nr:hypothetical protein [Methanophagales archaeon]